MRVSTEDQARERLQSSRTKGTIRTFCKFKGYEIVDYYQDAGISAKTGNYRPEFERLKAEIDTAFDYIPDESNDSVIYTKMIKRIDKAWTVLYTSIIRTSHVGMKGEGE